MKAKPLQIVSPDEFWATERSFEKLHRTREGHLSRSEQASNYDVRYDALLKRLSAVGTLVEGGGNAEFSMYRFVGPSGVITVVSDTETVFRTGALDAALTSIHESPTLFMVIFDTGSYIGVLPDGSVIGFSDWEDLSLYTNAESF